MSVEVDSQDVVRLMMQFMKENNLVASMKALHSETGVSLNTVDSVEGFVLDIQNGKWDMVLAQVANLQLPQDKQFAVSTLIIKHYV